MPVLRFNVTEGADPMQPGVGGDKVPCPFCGKDICLVFFRGLARDGFVVIDLAELSAMMQANVVAIAHLEPKCQRFGDMSRSDAIGKNATRSVLARLIETGQALLRTVAKEDESTSRPRGISGRALAHLICLERLEAHIMVCTKRSDQCAEAMVLTRAYQISFANLHPREQRRCAQLGKEMARRVSRARGN